MVATNRPPGVQAKISAMDKISRALSGLPDDASRAQVLEWINQEYGPAGTVNGAAPEGSREE